MRKTIHFLLNFLAILLTTSISAHAVVPESARSRAAILKVTPSLQADLKASGIAWGSPIFIRIFKEESELEVWLRKGAAFVKFRTYGICDFSGDLGPKLKEGDGQSPEGFYFVRPGAMNPSSSYHLSFNLGFPNAYDRQHGHTGSYLMVHGDCVSIGCYAMAKTLLPTGDRNDPIREIWTLMDAAFKNGQPFMRVHAFPFRMTAANMHRHRASRWAGFWKNLRGGFDFFETQKRPPNVEVRQKRYVFD